MSDLRKRLNAIQKEEPIKFWEKNKKTGEIKIIINALHKTLSSQGAFWKYCFDKQSAIIKITSGGIIEMATTEEMKSWLQGYVLNTYPEDALAITEALMRWTDSLFSKGQLEFMPQIKLNLLKHTPTEAYYPFTNGILKITPDKKEMVSYEDMGMHVWSGHILDFNFTLSDIDPVPLANSDFYRFLQKVNGDDEDRMKYASTIIGYMLHTYKDKNRPYAVILAEENENENKGGGTGKGIFYTAIGKMINAITVDGKAFKHDKPFLYQRASIDTQLIVIDDCRKTLDFQGFYSHITEGLTIERKNKPEVYIPYEDSPKFLFSTNFTINVEGEHGRRRTKVLEFSNFFTATNTPLAYFGHMLFTDWSAEDWNIFYNLMAVFVGEYLESGVVSNETSVSIKRKSVIQKFSREFVSYWDDLQKEAGEWRVLGEAYDQFIRESDVEERLYSRRKFHFAMEYAAGEFGYKFETKKNSMNGGKKDFWLGPEMAEIIPLVLEKSEIPF